MFKIVISSKINTVCLDTRLSRPTLIGRHVLHLFLYTVISVIPFSVCAVSSCRMCLRCLFSFLYLWLSY